MRKVQAAADAGQPRAQLALGMFVHRLAAAVGALTTTLGGLDALVFTGGIGEHSPRIRSATASRLEHLGVALDTAANDGADADADISGEPSRVKTLVVTAREDLTVLAELKRVLA
jgi:acetate kinase